MDKVPELFWRREICLRTKRERETGDGSLSPFPRGKGDKEPSPVSLCSIRRNVDGRISGRRRVMILLQVTLSSAAETI